MENAKWYVVHTYSGYENKVKANLEKIIENRGMQDEILQIEVPVQSVTEIKNGQKKNAQRKIFPGYVLIKMEMNDDTWYVVRNTRGVTSFVGPGSKPVALTEDEVFNLGVDSKIEIPDFYVGDTIRVSSGPFEGSVGVVKELNKHSVVVKLSIFGRETPVELELGQIELI
jgi:transcriptional antiterminator NusG